MKSAFLISQIESKRSKECLEAMKAKGEIKGNYIFIESAFIPELCGEHKPVVTSYKAEQEPMVQALAKEGIQWGTAISFITQKLGIKEGTMCQARKHLLNNIKEIGFAECCRQIKETFREQQSDGSVKWKKCE